MPPQLASLRSKPPAGDNWLHEIKYDGYRLQIHLDKGRVTIRTRTGLDWTIAGARDGGEITYRIFRTFRIAGFL